MADCHQTQHALGQHGRTAIIGIRTGGREFFSKIICDISESHKSGESFKSAGNEAIEEIRLIRLSEALAEVRAIFDNQGIEKTIRKLGFQNERHRETSQAIVVGYHSTRCKFRG